MIKQETLNLLSNTNIMELFWRFKLLLFVVILVIACKSKKVSLSGDEPVAVSDFIEFFPDVKLPFQVADSNLLKKEKDSLLISYKVFTQFVPDSVAGQIFGNAANPKIYPMGKSVQDEKYLFAKALSGNKRVALLICFDKKDQFLSAMPLLTLDQSASTQQTGVVDSRYAITRSMIRRNADGSTSEGKEVFVLNNAAKNFMLIVTDALDDKVTELTNPIDTFSRKQKFTGDYGSGKLNLVSIRDGRKNDRLSFFIHFDKDKGQCSGELKGEAIIKSGTVAEYREPGDPCLLRFSFTSSAVTVKELGGCGSRRGLRCSFDGVYPKKKEQKGKTVKPTGKPAL
jgi:hypothetical protein